MTKVIHITTRVKRKSPQKKTQTDQLQLGHLKTILEVKIK
jgi:hypothetical protein